jgi:hypothetical protein
VASFVRTTIPAVELDELTVELAHFAVIDNPGSGELAPKRGLNHVEGISAIGASDLAPSELLSRSAAPVRYEALSRAACI